MTLKVRNRIMQLFFFTSIFCMAVALCFFLAALFYKAIVPPPNLRIPFFLGKIPFLKYSFVATMVAISLITIFAPLMTFHIVKLFENTQSSEVIFFIGFLAGCLCEGVRFLTPLFGLWSTFSTLLFFCGRITFIGRILCPLSFVFAAIASSVEQRQDIERNIMILITICVVFALIVPINTARISSSGAVTWGYPKLIFISRIVFVMIAFFSFWVIAIRQNTPEYKKISIYMLILLIGHAFLVTADNYFFIILGLPLIVWGSNKYLRTLHSLYMWR